MQISPACCSGLLKKSRNPAAINKHSFVAKKAKEALICGCRSVRWPLKILQKIYMIHDRQHLTIPLWLC
jgi:hypothetical protein